MNTRGVLAVLLACCAASVHADVDGSGQETEIDCEVTAIDDNVGCDLEPWLVTMPTGVETNKWIDGGDRKYLVRTNNRDFSTCRLITLGGGPTGMLRGGEQNVRRTRRASGAPR